ncbi:MAG TPA: tetratricopeptide repeat protein, partial [Gemmataceae bacterium]|nr:tetratricopeptide repeat protein [Gemmataceae bacterium]
RLGGLAPVAGVVVALVVAAMLIVEGHRTEWQVRYRNAAEKLANADTDVSERRIALLQEAIRWGSDSAWSQLELGEVYLTAYQNRVDALDQFASLQLPALCLTIPLGSRDIASLETALAGVAAEPGTLEQIVPGYESGIEREYLGPALRYFVQARNLCPLLARAQLRLVALSAKLQLGDAPKRYLNRAKIVAGYDPEFWFMGGALALAEKRPDDCWPQWKRSLEISKKHFKEIIGQSRISLTPKHILDEVLPENASLVVETANLLLREPKDADERAVRTAYFKRAASLLRQEMGDIKADGWIVRAMVFQESGQNANAIAALRMGMSLDAKYEDMRLELAKLLLNNGDKAQAIRELGIVLMRQPENHEANQVYNEILMKN